MYTYSNKDDRINQSIQYINTYSNKDDRINITTWSETLLLMAAAYGMRDANRCKLACCLGRHAHVHYAVMDYRHMHVSYVNEDKYTRQVRNRKTWHVTAGQL